MYFQILLQKYNVLDFKGIQRKLNNMITLRPRETDNINQMITITVQFYRVTQVYQIKRQWKLNNMITFGLRETDNINQMITITGQFYTVPFIKLNL